MNKRRMRWYHRLIYRIPVVKSIGKYQCRKCLRAGAAWGLEEGARLVGKRISQRKIRRAMDKCGALRLREER